MAQSEARWSHHGGQDLDRLSAPALKAVHAEMTAVAEALSGQTRDAAQRAVAYLSVFEASGGNFMFPLVATHGSLWGVTHTLRIEDALVRLRPISRHGRIQGWLDALDAVRDINRRVFVEIFSTFYFTRYFGHHPAAGDLVDRELLDVYNRAHEAARTGTLLSWEIRRDDYFTVFTHEQDDIVDPGIQEAIAGCRPRSLVGLFGLVRPRFLYFPPGKRLWFTDFTSVHERNREGIRALEFAEQVGSDRVIDAMGEYSI
jgi:hypothetical protein